MNAKVLLMAFLVSLASACYALGTGSLPADVTLFLAGDTGLIDNFDATMGVPPSGLTAGTQICQAGTTTKFVDPGSGTNMVAYFCTAASSMGLSIQNAKLLLYFRGNGGSTFGVDPVGQYSIGRYKISATGCGSGTTSPVTCSSWNNNTASADYTTQIPDLGLTQVEPLVFISPSPNVSAQPTDCKNTFFIDPCPAGTGMPGVATVSLVLAQATVIAVNAAMNSSLQGMQGLSGNQVPSLSPAEAGSIFTEGSVLSNGPSAPNWSYLSNAMIGRFPNGTPFSGNMTICRGISGLGTVAAFNATMLANPCATGLPGGAKSMVVSSKTGISVTQANPVGAVLTCLQNATTPAMGLVTLDQLSKARSTGLYFVKIDGRPMIDANTINDSAVQNGFYDPTTEATLQVSNGVSGNALTAATALKTALQTATPSPGIYNILGLGTSRPMAVSRYGRSCSPPQK